MQPCYPRWSRLSRTIAGGDFPERGGLASKGYSQKSRQGVQTKAFKGTCPNSQGSKGLAKGVLLLLVRRGQEERSSRIEKFEKRRSWKSEIKDQRLKVNAQAEEP
jgi:hypothetical protein